MNDAKLFGEKVSALPDIATLDVDLLCWGSLLLGLALVFIFPEIATWLPNKLK